MQFSIPPQVSTSNTSSDPRSKEAVSVPTNANPPPKSAVKTTKISDADIKNHPLYKNQLSQLEICRGTNVSLSNKLSRLDESVRIMETKNLYLQDENQRLKGINEGMSSTRVGQKVSVSENTDPRVLLLEHDSLATKLKFLEDSFDKKFEALKANLEKKAANTEKYFKETQNKHREYFEDKIYEMRSKIRDFPSYSSHNECDRRINKVSTGKISKIRNFG